jgi:hypothetical protein
MMHEPAATALPERSSAPNLSRSKQPAFLVTSDDSLWAQIGHIGMGQRSPSAPKSGFPFVCPPDEPADE